MGLFDSKKKRDEERDEQARREKIRASQRRYNDEMLDPTSLSSPLHPSYIPDNSSSCDSSSSDSSSSDSSSSCDSGGGGGSDGG